METFDRNAVEALRDEPLRNALRHATGQFAGRRRQATADLGESTWQALRSRGREIKDDVLGDLDRYLRQFIDKARSVGAVIHVATDAATACRQIAEIIAREGGGVVAKGKSMTSEEIRLNEYLEARGVEPVETDLGEWIVQIAREVPSHIIVPAIHRSKASIAALFAEHLGTDPAADVDALTKAARGALRDRFLAARVGISGVNFAVAETGSILVLENEGNIRLSTTLPRVHIALMGIEKVVPRLADLATFLRLLPRAGTGQRLTSYQSLLTGPGARAGEGPAELHIVLLDNGRSEILADPVMREALACIRCGACLNVCPIYQNVGGHAYGSVYPGPIGAVVSPQLFGLDKAAQLPFASTLCGACRDACPVKIDIPKLLLHLRSELVQPRGMRDVTGGAARKRLRLVERLAFGLWSFVVRGRRRYAVATWIARKLFRLFHREAWVQGGVFAPKAWTRGRDLRALAPRSFHALYAERAHAPGARQR
jgi:L-lactate dehydrogenase complex protein LldF